MVMCHGYPFFMCEHYFTRRFISNLQSLFKLDHRTSVKENCLKVYEEERVKLHETLGKNLSWNSTTSDLWIAIDMSCYMRMAAHH